MSDNFFERNNVRCDRCGATHPAPDDAPPPPHWAYVIINLRYNTERWLPPPTAPEALPTSHQWFHDDLWGGDALCLCDRCLASLVEWYRCMRSAPEWYLDMPTAP